MGLYKTKGVVLRTRDYGEADRIVIIYTEEAGKVPAVAKGARRPRCRLRGVTQNFVLAEYLLFSSKSLDTISQGESIEAFAPLREDLTRMAYASYFAELVDKFTLERARAPELFHLLVEVFTMLCAHVQPEVVARWGELRLMTLLGYAPHLDSCVRCGHTISEGVFLPGEGGVAHYHCSPGTEYTLSQGALASLRSLADMSGQGVLNLRLGPQVELQLRLALRSHLAQHISGELKSLDFLLSVID